MPPQAQALKRPFHAIDLFAGAGGLTTGLELGGFKSLFANEISSAYAETLCKNHPETKVLTEDIREASATEIRNSLGLAKKQLDLLAGGPPCQGFSINAPVRSIGDKRNHLFVEFLRFVEEFQPKTVLIENVPGMLSFNKGETVRAIHDRFTRLGYAVSVRILYAAHFGVPQMRWRTVFLATRLPIDPVLFFPEVTHLAPARANFSTNYEGISIIADSGSVMEKARTPFTTVNEAISDLPPLENGESFSGEYPNPPANAYQTELRTNATTLWNHECAGLAKPNLERLKHIPQGGSWRDIPFELLPAGMRKARRSDHTKRYGRLDPRGLGSTILTKCDPHWGAYFHPTQDRVISVREAARLQSFPDSIRFFGSVTDQYKQVGNAVPPVLAKAIAERIIYCLQCHESRRKISPTLFANHRQTMLTLNTE